jgi:outer membrane protein
MRRTTNVIGTILLLAVALTAATAVTAAEDDPWLVRTRLIYIAPNDDADGALGEANVGVESDFTVEVDLSYFFTPRCSIEAILATAAQEVTVPDSGGEVSLGSVYHAPATVLAQYHFNTDAAFQPYVGAGVNFTIFYSESGQLADLDLDSTSIGWAAQAGLDYELTENTVFNFDVKYITIETDVAAGGDDLGTVKVDPLVIGAGFGFRF